MKRLSPLAGSSGPERVDRNIEELEDAVAATSPHIESLAPRLSADEGDRYWMYRDNEDASQLSAELEAARHLRDTPDGWAIAPLPRRPAAKGNIHRVGPKFASWLTQQFD